MTLDGVPLAFKTVEFIPERGISNRRAVGETDRDGRYSLQTVVTHRSTLLEGCSPGQYRVTAYEIPRWPPLRARGKIPRIYRSFESTPVLIEVPGAGCVVDLDLTTAADTATSD